MGGLWTAIAGAIRLHNVSFLGGDFNMALFQVKDTLRQEGVEATFLGSYAWRQLDTCGGGAVPVPDYSGCRFDSLALFALKPVPAFARLYTTPTLRGNGMTALDESEQSQGYPAASYVGGSAQS